MAAGVFDSFLEWSGKRFDDVLQYATTVYQSKAQIAQAKADSEKYATAQQIVSADPFNAQNLLLIGGAVAVVYFGFIKK